MQCCSLEKLVKVTIYLSDGATHHGAPLYSSILDFLFYRGVAGATVTKGIAGFGADHHHARRESDRHLRPAADQD